MKKKSILVIMLIALFSLSVLAGCSATSDTPDYADKDFIKSVGKGLEARWKLQDKQESDTVESLTASIQAELDAVDEYKSATFEDSVLQEKALKYINVLNESLENVEYYFSDDEYQKWSDIYDERTILIKDFADNYELKVSDKYQATLDELVANGKTAGAQATQKDAMEKLVAGLNFEMVKNDDGWKDYEAVLENTSEFDIEELSIDVSLLDKDGVIVETNYVSAENVAKGQKAKLQFSTDAEFDRYELVVSYYSVK